jgi:hypothetical protein
VLPSRDHDLDHDHDHMVWEIRDQERDARYQQQLAHESWQGLSSIALLDYLGQSRRGYMRDVLCLFKSKLCHHFNNFHDEGGMKTSLEREVGSMDDLLPNHVKNI